MGQSALIFFKELVVVMNLKTKIPPPLVTIAFGILIYYSTEIIPSVTFTFQGLLGALFLIAGLGVMISAILTFRRLQTTINPLQPNTASSLASTGVFKLSRNPMYLAMLLILIALALYTGAVASIFLLPGFIIYISVFQIVPEEQAMQELFSQAYADYCKQVRRWI